MNSPITLDALKVLDAIERKQSFAAAADSLFKVPSALSYTVNKLEEDLGVAIFDRSKRKAELTPIGKMLVDQGRLILKATDELTHLARQSADGWEAELRICIDSVLEFAPIYDVVSEFNKAHPWINIKLSEEVLGGTWDSLIAQDCDLAIGATGEPYSSDFCVESIGRVEFIFAVAKDHPLCKLSPPISEDMIKQYSSIVVADSSRNLPTRSVGLLDGQARIVVPSMQKKIEAQIKGVGVGFLPVHRIKNALATDELKALSLATNSNRTNELSLAWRKDNKGKALAWFVGRVKEISHKFS